MKGDSSLALLREGYDFVPSRCRRHGTDVFETRLMLQPAICMSGPEAASVFYAEGRFTRRRALPPTALTLLQDRGSAAMLDGAAHRHRKEMFLVLMQPGRFDSLLELTAAEWRSAGDRWQRRSAVVLHEAAQEVLCRAVCSWAGVPLEESEVPNRWVLLDLYGTNRDARAWEEPDRFLPERFRNWGGTRTRSSPRAGATTIPGIAARASGSPSRSPCRR